MFIRNFIFFATCLTFLQAGGSSYYDDEPCQKYRTEDFPVVVFPWDDKGNNCYSPSAIQQLKIFGHSTIVESLEAKVADDLKRYREYQNGVADTLLCCASSDSGCKSDPEVASFCGGSDSQSGFNAYLNDLNARLGALRIAAYRLQGKSNQGAQKEPISSPKPLLMKMFDSAIPETISIARMPGFLVPLTQEELMLAHDVQKNKDNDFLYKSFITEDPEVDYFVILNSAPFLGEISKAKIEKKDFYNLMKSHIERNKKDSEKFQDVYYRDLMPTVSKNIEKHSHGEAQRNLCRYAEFRRRLSLAGAVVLKQFPLLVATIYGGSRGLKVAPGASISETLKNLGVSIGKASSPAITAAGALDLYRIKQLDRYCQKKAVDDDITTQAPICNQAAVLSGLDDTQTNIFVGSTINVGFMAFRYGKQLKSQLPRSKSSNRP
ncbi:MAG: hypothetical protein IPM97_12725 [Bdellovibrionaceae bacterium]|nr:hypothetical protein [Pseudobdellovibrionaceae bacterium]